MANPQVPPHPQHGEEGHDCPLDHWFELRFQGVDIARLDDALEQLHNRMQAMVMAAILEGITPQDQIEAALQDLDEIRDLGERLNKPLAAEYDEQKARWHVYKEHNV